MPAWVKHFKGRVVVMPRNTKGQPRNFPDKIVLSPALSKAYESIFDRVQAAISSIFQPTLWKELNLLYKRNLLSIGTFRGAFKAVTHVMLVRKVLLREYRNRAHPSLVYTYWFSYPTYAAVASALRSSVLTRAHGGDLYEDRSPEGHLYLRRQFIRQIDRVYAISDDGVRYLRDIFSADRNVSLSRLGVSVPDVSSPPTAAEAVSILSLSYCVSVKNIDRIIEGIRIASERNPATEFIWRHIGDGPLRATLEAHAGRAFAATSVRWQFLAHMENIDVLRFMEENSIDFILNASSSEGIPVSIMEAMARGIPAIAPDVGGISELVGEEFGVLLPSKASSEDIADAITMRIDYLKSSVVRNGAKEKIKKIYNSELNYEHFIRDVITLTDPGDLDALQ
tara:strand:- start:11748 stop:12932 length:1185 start_codon:yes stop_codon:yes gene_type:complete